MAGDGGWDNTVMNGMTGWTIHRVQGRRDGDYHAHPEAEQLYYFLTPAKMLIDGATIAARGYIDRHYYSIASKATLLRPAQVRTPP